MLEGVCIERDRRGHPLGHLNPEQHIHANDGNERETETLFSPTAVVQQETGDHPFDGVDQIVVEEELEADVVALTAEVVPFQSAGIPNDSPESDEHYPQVQQQQNTDMARKVEPEALIATLPCPRHHNVEEEQIPGVQPRNVEHGLRHVRMLDNGHHENEAAEPSVPVFPCVGEDAHNAEPEDEDAHRRKLTLVSKELSQRLGPSAKAVRHNRSIT